MLVTAENKGYTIYDASHKGIANVHSFDTITNEIKMYIKRDYPSEDLLMETVGEHYKPMIASFILNGAYAKDEKRERINPVIKKEDDEDKEETLQ